MRLVFIFGHDFSRTAWIKYLKKGKTTETQGEYLDLIYRLYQIAVKFNIDLNTKLTPLSYIIGIKL